MLPNEQLLVRLQSMGSLANDERVVVKRCGGLFLIAAVGNIKKQQDHHQTAR